MDEAREGGCQCGQVRYRFEGAPLAIAACHCTECQRQSGSAFGMSLLVPENSFQLTAGKLRDFTRSSDSGRPVRCAFCPDCGTRIYHDPTYAQGILNIKPGTLDDTSWLEPTAHVWTGSKQPWTPIPEGGRCFEKQPG